MPDDRLTSLLACLNKLPGSLHLDCPVVSDDHSILEKTPFPFVTVTDADPCARLLKGSILTEARSVLREVFLLVQRDRYLLKDDPLRPVTNRDMEEAWRKTCQAYEKDGDFPLIHVVSPGAGPLPPLLYCTRTRLFFQAPCPRCGALLGQCEDDDLLGALGLAPYGRSLKRYLFCPDCSKTGVPLFYAFEREAGDPPAVRDRFSLFGDFAQLRGQDSGKIAFPCPGCPEKGVCYGAGAAALTRIVPFSFYPFNLVIVEAPHLSGLDFLALASGASFAERERKLERGAEGWRKSAVSRLGQRCGGRAPFVAADPGRRFFEVLYLKLSFLGDVYNHLVSSPDPFGSAGRGFAPDRLWVALGEPGKLLPFLWNFRVRFIGLRDDPSQGSAFAGLPASNDIVSLGLLWFYALLVNARHDGGDILLSLKEAVRSRTLAEALPVEDALIPETSTFSPVNVFWQPEGVAPDEHWRDLWEGALGLGWSLLRAGVSWDEQWLTGQFRQGLESLREDVKAALLQAGPPIVASSISQEAFGDDARIRELLTRIAGRWRAGLEAEKAELAETVILSTTILAPSPAGEPLAETVMLGPGGVVPAEKTRIAAKRIPEGERAEPAEREMPREEQRPGSQQPRVDDLLAETVIISRGARPRFQPDPAALGDETRKEGEVSVGQGHDSPAKPLKKASADDELAQTVIIDPAKLRPRR